MTRIHTRILPVVHACCPAGLAIGYKVVLDAGRTTFDDSLYGAVMGCLRMEPKKMVTVRKEVNAAQVRG